MTSPSYDQTFKQISDACQELFQADLVGLEAHLENYDPCVYLTLQLRINNPRALSADSFETTRARLAGQTEKTTILPTGRRIMQLRPDTDTEVSFEHDPQPELDPAQR